MTARQARTTDVVLERRRPRRRRRCAASASRCATARCSASPAGWAPAVPSCCRCSSVRSRCAPGTVRLDGGRSRFVAHRRRDARRDRVRAEDRGEAAFPELSLAREPVGRGRSSSYWSTSGCAAARGARRRPRSDGRVLDPRVVGTPAMATLSGGNQQKVDPGALAAPAPEGAPPRRADPRRRRRARRHDLYAFIASGRGGRRAVVVVARTTSRSSRASPTVCSCMVRRSGRGRARHRRDSTPRRARLADRTRRRSMSRSTCARTTDRNATMRSGSSSGTRSCSCSSPCWSSSASGARRRHVPHLRQHQERPRQPGRASASSRSRS